MLYDEVNDTEAVVSVLAMDESYEQHIYEHTPRSSCAFTSGYLWNLSGAGYAHIRHEYYGIRGFRQLC
jgi:hypothetical protein